MALNVPYFLTFPTLDSPFLHRIKGGQYSIAEMMTENFLASSKDISDKFLLWAIGSLILGEDNCPSRSIKDLTFYSTYK
jgi:hypothetical protein